MAINFTDGKYVDENGRVTLDPTVYKDWQIAEEAEKTLPPVEYFREKLGLLPDEIIPYGKTPKLDFIKIMNRLKDKPVYITENGVCADNDDFRLVWLAEYLSAINESIKAGVDVRGYLYWSLMDNWEWASWKPKFGLVSVDREHGFKRIPKPSAYFYREIIEQNGFKADILKKYLKEMPRVQDYHL